MTSSYSAIHRYDKVQDGYTTETYTEEVASGTETYTCGTRDLGNGAFEDVECTRTTYTTVTKTREIPKYRDEPVYETKYRFEIERWAGAGSVPASGNDHNPRWPEVSTGGNRRESGRSERYTITLSANDGQEVKTYETPSYQEWASYETRQRVVVSVNGLGAVTSIKPAQ